MWIFTKYGFFSAVCARQGDGKHGRPVDPKRMMIRARVRSHLEALKRRFENALGDCGIVESGSTDYAFRLFAQKEVWAKVSQPGGDQMECSKPKRRLVNQDRKLLLEQRRCLLKVTTHARMACRADRPVPHCAGWNRLVRRRVRRHLAIWTWMPCGAFSGRRTTDGAPGSSGCSRGFFGIGFIGL